MFGCMETAVVVWGNRLSVSLVVLCFLKVFPSKCTPWMSTSVPSPKVYHMTLSPAHISRPFRLPYMHPFMAEIQNTHRQKQELWWVMTKWWVTVSKILAKSSYYRASYCFPWSLHPNDWLYPEQNRQYSPSNTNSHFHPWQKTGGRIPYPRLSVKPTQCSGDSRESMTLWLTIDICALQHFSTHQPCNAAGTSDSQTIMQPHLSSVGRQRPFFAHEQRSHQSRVCVSDWICAREV